MIGTIYTYDICWAWLENDVDMSEILAEYFDEYSTSFDDVVKDVIWVLWDIYPHGKLCRNAVSDYVSLLL